MENNELKLLKARANELGVTFRDNISADTLRERVERAAAALEKAPEPDIIEQTPTEAKISKEREKMTEEQYIRTKEFRETQKEANRLIRCQVTNMDPQEKDITGAVFDVGNAFTGKISKYVPFGKTWHVPKMILDDLQTRQFLQVKMVNNGGFKETMETRYLPKYSINILPDLTMEERKTLAAAQGFVEE